MIRPGETICPKCGGKMVKNGKPTRKIRTKYGRTTMLQLQQWKCMSCRITHREIPEEVLPYQRFEAEIIRGVQEGLITCETLGFEDYPTEETMRTWRKGL